MPSTFNIRFIPEPSVSSLSAGLSQLEQQGSAAILILSCCANELNADNLNASLAEQKVPVFGGIFPEIVDSGKRHTQGHLLVGFPQAPIIHVQENLSQPDTSDETECVYKAVSQAYAARQNPNSGYLVIADGLSDHIEQLISALHSQFGVDTQFIGGGTGCLDFQPRPTVICNQQLLQDAALIVDLQMPISVSVSHGWQPMAGPYLATQVSGKKINSLNFKPAYQVYQDVLKTKAGREITVDQFFDTAKQFPFGMELHHQEYLIRDPIQSDGDSLDCVGHIPEQSLVYIMKGDADTLIDAARQAAQAMSAAISVDAPPLTMLFDCVSRTLSLGERLHDEISAISDAFSKNTIFGALSLGEIANVNDSGVRFHNKTTAIAISSNNE